MTYIKEYEQYKYKPLRAALLIAAIAADIAAILSAAAGLFKPIFFAATAACVVASLVMRRITLHIVYSYEYLLRDSKLKVSKKIIGKSKELADISCEDIKRVSAYDGGAGAEKMYIGDISGVYLVETAAGRKLALRLDDYMYAVLVGEKSLAGEEQS